MGIFHLSELSQKSHIVLVKQSHIVDVVSAHCDTFKTDTECKAAVDLGVDAAASEDFGVDHTRAEKLNISLALAHRAALAAAVEAYEIDLCGGFCVGEVVGTETNFSVLAVKLLHKEVKCAVKVAQSNALVDNKSLYLVEKR